MKVINRKYLTMSMHVIGWLIFAFSVMFSRPGEWFFDQSKAICIRQFVLLAIFIGVFYLNIYLLVPQLYLKNRTGTYMLVVVGTHGAAIYFNNLSTSVFYGQREGKYSVENKHHQQDHQKHFDAFVPGMIALMIGFSISISLTGEWQQEQFRRQQLEKEKSSSVVANGPRQLDALLKEKNIEHKYTESSGGHSMTNWRQYLHDFSTLISR